ncbi:MAG: sugar O-acetyltransferase [Clostridia bacterium]|nr:sugar O-acetyltransferase [Clostridia bacterium]
MELKELIESIHNSDLYNCMDEELLAEQARCLELQYEYNNTRPSEGARRKELLKKMLADCGEGCYVEPPLHANWGGHNLHFGDNVYANFNLTVVDDTHVYVGNNVLFAPNVILSTAGHPIEPSLRASGYQFNAPIHIGNNVWLGAGVIVMPGVTIGDNSVIGAGSVVTKDIPPNVVAFGTPCRVVREIGDRDKEYYFKNRKIDYSKIDK